jgi:hypothetical protein
MHAPGRETERLSFRDHRLLRQLLSNCRAMECLARCADKGQVNRALGDIEGGEACLVVREVRQRTLGVRRVSGPTGRSGDLRPSLGIGAVRLHDDAASAAREC